MGLDTLLPGVNFQGNDLFGLRVSSVTTCATACKREPRCQAFTFITTEANSAKRCWLKNARYWRQVTHSSGTVSGKRREHERTTAAAQAMEAGPATRPVGDVYRTNRSDAADSHIRAEVSEVSDASAPSIAWRAMRACTPPSSTLERNTWSTCESASYESYFSRLTSTFPAFELEQLKMPAHTRVLLFGTSYTKQIVGEIFCAGNYHFVRKVLTDCRRKPHLQLMELHDQLRNTTLVSVTNHRQLQQSDAISTGALSDFLSNYFFDIILFMPPHPDCYFVWVEQSCYNESAAYPQCVDLEYRDVVESTQRVESRMWELMQRSARVAAFWVTKWSAARPRKMPFGTSPDSFIDSGMHVRAYPCQTPSCKPTASGHQCRPSAVTLLARKITLAINTAHARWLTQVASSSDMRLAALEHETNKLRAQLQTEKEEHEAVSI
jgi:hypothetical protein